jgi:hypothetical protein
MNVRDNFDVTAPTPIVSPHSAPVRGSVDRPDFRDVAKEEDPAAVSSEALARAQASADRRAQAHARDQVRTPAPSLAPSADVRLQALERRIQSLEAENIVMRARLTALEEQRPSKPRVSRLRDDPTLPGAA